MKAPSCKHVGAHGPDSVLVSSVKDIRKGKGRMASARVCDRPKCVAEAIAWVEAYMGYRGSVWRNGVKVQ